MRIRQLLAGLVLMLVALSAAALNRSFPLEAKRGLVSFAVYPKMIINDTERKPAAGLRIWNTNNMIQFRSTLRTDKVIINYTEDYLKQIDRIWILTPAEAAKPPPNQKP
jgi:hypothetical protein